MSFGTVPECQRAKYVPGLAVDRARDAYRGESKTDDRDARNEADLEDIPTDGLWQPCQSNPENSVWTDDFSNLLSAFLFD